MSKRQKRLNAVDAHNKRYAKLSPKQRAKSAARWIYGPISANRPSRRARNGVPGKTNKCKGYPKHPITIILGRKEDAINRGRDKLDALMRCAGIQSTL